MNSQNHSDPAIVAVFDDPLAAEAAVDELTQSGFSSQDVGFVLRGKDVESTGMISDAVGTKDGKGAVAGAITGAAAGGLIAAAVTAMIPGVGPVLAAGMLAMLVGYAGAGAAIGGIFGALIGLGISEDEARYYEKHFNEGRALVAVKPGTRAHLAAEILRRHGGYDLQNQINPDIKTTGIFSEP